MKNTLALTLICFMIQSIGAQTPARTKIEKRLAEMLAPDGKAAGTTMPANPPPRKLQPSVERPELPLKSVPVLPPAPPKLPTKSVHPRNLPEEAPLVRVFFQPDPPQAVTMATAPLIRLWSWNVDVPQPLPILSAGIRDRASLGDVSLEASVAAAQAKLSPARSQQVPFQPQNLPDPFENSQTIRLRNPPDEISDPPLSIRPLGR